MIVPLALVRQPAPSADAPGRMQALPEKSRFICNETEKSGLIVRVLPAVAESTLTLSCEVVNLAGTLHGRQHYTFKADTGFPTTLSTHPGVPGAGYYEVQLLLGEGGKSWKKPSGP